MTDREMLELAAKAAGLEVGARPMALRMNKDGTPGHPLYLPKTLVPLEIPA